MSSKKIRKLTFFFPVSKDNGPTDRQLVKSYVVGQAVIQSQITSIEERIDSITGIQSFIINVSDPKDRMKETLWKSYVPKASDIEIEYEL